MYFQKLTSYVNRHRVGIAFIFILIISAFFRFFEYGNRIGFGYDQARDMIVANYALFHHSLPIIGPFSSAGPFVYGPQWYWILMGMSALYPFYIFTPWIVQTILYLGIVVLMYMIGKELKDEYLGLLLALLTGFSSGQIAQATNLTSPSMVGIMAVGATYFLLLSIKYSKGWDYFILSFLVGNAICTHFQAIGLMAFLPLAFIFGKRKLIFIFYICIGFIIPFTPLLIFDFLSNHFESRNLFQYYFHDQYKTSFEVLGRRWATYVAQFWPFAWARIIGGSYFVIYGLFGLGGSYILLKKREIEKLTAVFMIVFFVVFVELRFFRGPLFDAYLVFLHPIILSLTGILLYNIIRESKYIGFLACSIVLLGSVWLTFQDISYSNTIAARAFSNLSLQLTSKYPNEKIVLYDYKYKTSAVSIPLSFFISTHNNPGPKEMALGLYSGSSKKKNTLVVSGYTFKKLNKNETRDKRWISVDPANVYHSVVEWYKK